MKSIGRKQILELFESLNRKLKKHKIKGEMYLVGGAVMCLVFQAREATKDIDALFVPKEKIRPLIEEIAQEENLPPKWINDGVTAFLSQKEDFDNFLNLSHLKVFSAVPEYLLAMKCLAMRIGPQFQDEDDIRYLLRYLNIESYEEAIEIISRYYPNDRFPQKSFYALEEILEK